MAVFHVPWETEGEGHGSRWEREGRCVVEDDSVRYGETMIMMDTATIVVRVAAQMLYL